MAQIKIETTITVDDTNSSTLPITTTKTITYTAKSDAEYSIASGSVPFDNTEYQTVFDTDAATAGAAADNVGPNNDFDFLIIISNQSIIVELAGDVSANGADDINIITVAANTPLILAADDTYIDYGNATGFAHASAVTQVIERVRIGNISGSTATVRVIQGT